MTVKLSDKFMIRIRILENGRYRTIHCFKETPKNVFNIFKIALEISKKPSYKMGDYVIEEHHIGGVGWISNFTSFPLSNLYCMLKGTEYEKELEKLREAKE